jgi:cytochrome c oxidase assembly protein subunit 15
MPFDDRTFPSVEAAELRRRRHHVALWLFLIAYMIWGMVVLGGATRLTGSGLSIMEWAPLSGALPPLSHAEWTRVFAEYQAIPQYHLLHQGMGLEGFKSLFWLEWIHRFWGRLMAVAFVFPLAWFAYRGSIDRRLAWRLVALFALGALQGLVGWVMVASGFFPDSTAVSPYRLVVHLALALCLFAAVLWTALSVRDPVPVSLPGAVQVRRFCQFALVMVALTVVAGGFTAGLHAGLVYNTFPLMDGRLFPAGYGDLHPALRNLTENVTAVQFDHRLLATLTALTIGAAIVSALRTRLPRPQRVAVLVMGAAALAQYLLGIATVLSVVDIPIAVAHQGVAVLLLTSTLVAIHSLRGAR